jgi:hypothetical protein
LAGDVAVATVVFANATDMLANSATTKPVSRARPMNMT